MAAAHAVRQKIADCDHKLAKYRAALDAGADPAVVAAWITEVTANRATAQAQLSAITPGRRLTRVEIHALISSADKAEVYQQLGLRLDYQPESRSVLAEAHVGAGHGSNRVSEGRHEP
jgi:site-specific DNA recombinase